MTSRMPIIRIIAAAFAVLTAAAEAQTAAAAEARTAAAAEASRTAVCGDTVSRSGEAGTAGMEVLRDKLEEYLNSIRTEPLEMQCREADFLIGSCSDSTVRQAVALKIFDHYLQSKIMGAEGVAVHLCDEWFIPGKIKMRSPEELMTARIFAEFNRSSLVGMKAPELSLRDTTGACVTLFPASGNAGEKRFCILYFYAADCAKCRLESMMLKEILDNGNYPVTLCAVYTGDSREEWLRYIDERLDFSAPDTEVRHLWDPDLSSGFQMKYGVLETPRMFLIGPDGIIEGRGLDSQALEQMLKMLLTPKETEYGSDAAFSFYDKVFEETTGCDEIRRTVDHIAERTLKYAHDTLLFKQMTGDLLYYLSGRREAAFKCGAEHLCDSLILCRADLWNTREDTLKVIDLARIMTDLYSRARPGSRIPDITVHGVLLDGRRERPGKYALDRLRGDTNLIIFHTEGCGICRAELAAARELACGKTAGDMNGTAGDLTDRTTRRKAGKPKVKILLVDMDEVFTSWPEEAESLFNAFDLTGLPYIIETDRSGIVTDRYMSLAADADAPSAADRISDD